MELVFGYVYVQFVQVEISVGYEGVSGKCV